MDFEEQPPSASGLIRMVTSVVREFQEKHQKTRRGKFMIRFHQVCRTLKSHETMLEILPKGNEYVSLFSGTLMSVIKVCEVKLIVNVFRPLMRMAKASANHEQISKGLADALIEIGDHIEACQTELVIFPTENMQRSVGSLYAHIFCFLRGVMKWYMKKSRSRLLDSFNENLYDHFQEDVQNIKRFSDRVRRIAQQGMMAETRSTRIGVEDLQTNMQIGLYGVERSYVEQTRELGKLRDEQKKYREQVQRLLDRDDILRLVASSLTLLNSSFLGSHAIKGSGSVQLFRFLKLILVRP
jgi:hypothetical protein